METLYEIYGADVRKASKAASAFEQSTIKEIAEKGLPKCSGQIGTSEAELLYLSLRCNAPEEVLEVGALCGWSTFWVLQALSDNGHGRLTTSDVTNRVTQFIREDTTPAGSFKRWRFLQGDALKTVPTTGDSFDFFFIDALHENWFAVRYTKEIFEATAVRDRTVPAVVHDVYNPLMHPEYRHCLDIDNNKMAFENLDRYMRCMSDTQEATVQTVSGKNRGAVQRLFGPATPSGEGAALLEWVAESGLVEKGLFTLSPFRSVEHYRHALSIRVKHGLVTEEEGQRAAMNNPAIFFAFQIPGLQKK